jgi:signal peptidase I
VSRLRELAGWLDHARVGFEHGSARAASLTAGRFAAAGNARRRLGRAAHRLRYLPVACVAIGFVLLLLSPPREPTAREELGDDSMAPAITAGALITVDRHAFADRPPAIGEIVTFHPPAGERCARRPAPGSACATTGNVPERGEGVKRIVAAGGSTVSLIDGHLLTNGQAVIEPSAHRACVSRRWCDLPEPVRLPAGTWWVLADNRNAPNDSRSYGPIPSGWITGLLRSPPALKARTSRAPARAAG